MKDTQVDGNQDERGLRGDPGADRTAGDGTRDQEIQQLVADRDHAREERDTLLAEVCICAAVLTEEGLTIRGHRHHDAMRAAGFAFCTPKRGEEAQGFITSTGRYVDRREGYRLQVAAGIGSKASGGYRGEILFSEDLY